MKLLAKIGMAGGFGFSVFVVSILYNMFFWWLVNQAGEEFTLTSIPFWIVGIVISAVYFIALGGVLLFLVRLKGFKKSD